LRPVLECLAVGRTDLGLLFNGLKTTVLLQRACIAGAAKLEPTLSTSITGGWLSHGECQRLYGLLVDRLPDVEKFSVANRRLSLPTWDQELNAYASFQRLAITTARSLLEVFARAGASQLGVFMTMVPSLSGLPL
jgi:hypothetical protein